MECAVKYGIWNVKEQNPQAQQALMEAGLPMDRRIRIVMGCYEDSNPGVPTKEDTLKYMDIPYYTSNPSFYDNWCYKSLKVNPFTFANFCIRLQSLPYLLIAAEYRSLQSLYY